MKCQYWLIAGWGIKPEAQAAVFFVCEDPRRDESDLLQLVRSGVLQVLGDAADSIAELLRREAQILHEEFMLDELDSISTTSTYEGEIAALCQSMARAAKDALRLEM